MSTDPQPPGPWFRRHARLAACVVALLVAGITVLRFAVGDARDPIGLLFSLPIALAALAWGLRAGVASAALGIGLVSGWSIIESAPIGAAGWVTRIVPLGLLGILLGRASDEQRAAEADRLRLAVAETRRRDAAEINDLIVQRLAAARWTIEAGNTEAALSELEHVIGVAQELVADLLADDSLTDRMQRRRPTVSWEDLA